MKKYLAVYMAPAAQIEKWSHSSPEDMKDGMKEWDVWADTHKGSIADMGAPVGANKRVTSAGSTDQTNEVCGYTVLQAESHDEAAAIMQDNPHLKQDGVWVDVLECMEM